MDTSFLTSVSKPTRYTGGEVNQVLKDETPGLIHAAIAFPDGYEIAMSSVGLAILYSVLNASPRVWAERAFMPMPDMAAEMEKRGIPLFSLESKRPLAEFDVVGFSLQFELCYTNVLHMLKSGEIPLRAADRGVGDPVVIAGGPCACNPEPLAPFMDAVFVGDGEEGFLELCEAAAAKKGASRSELWRALSEVEGTYVPALYHTERSRFGMEIATAPLEEGIPYPVKKRLLEDLGRFPFPRKVLVPHHEVVHDRYSVEIARGCSAGCRFCQAGYVYRPTRERSPAEIVDSVRGGIGSTGFEEATLLSLNAGEYEGVSELAAGIVSDESIGVRSLALPSMRVDALTPELLDSIQSGRKGGFTIAPEAGSQRMRDLINKKVTEEEVVEAARILFSGGWRLVKLYFMIGLPDETEEDIKAIASLAELVLKTGRRAGCAHPRVTVSVSSFIPKAFTPFQWMPMEDAESLYEKQRLLKKLLKGPITFKWHDVKAGMVESVFSLGDRRLADVLEKACELGCRLDGWTEHFDFDLWKRAFAECDVEPSDYFSTRRDKDERFPWECVDVGVDRAFLRRELEKAENGRITERCGPERCFRCGSFNKKCVEGIFKRSGGDLPETHLERRPHVAEATWRLKFRKEKLARFLGHLDLVDALVRALRRCGVIFAYSGGFHPTPKVLFTAPLPLGVEGKEEWMEFTGRVPDSSTLLSRLAEGLPAGLAPMGLVRVPPGSPSLSMLNVQIYRIGFGELVETERSALLERAESFMEASEWVVEKRGKKKTKRFDLRQRVINMKREGDRLVVRLRMGGFMNLVGLLCPDSELKNRLQLERLSLEFGR